MKQLASIFKLSKEEQRPALWIGLYLLLLESMAVYYGWQRFGDVTTGIHSLLIGRFHVSGFDAWTYEIMTEWSPAYDIYRHPLIAFFLYPGYWLNQGLLWLFGSNFSMLLMGCVNLFCGSYALVFLRRILRQIIGLETLDSNLLTFFFMSLGYVMLTFCVPDHFCVSLMLLLLTLWISGRQLREGRPMRVGTAVWLFVLTAGVSLNNGLKTFLAALFVNGRRFFRPRFLAFAVVLPSLLLGLFTVAEYQVFEQPRVDARMALARKQRQEHRRQLEARIKDTLQVQDSALLAKAVKVQLGKEAREQYRKNHEKTGIPFQNTGLLSWTNKSTDRWSAIIENFMGESMVFHRSHLLEDVLRARPEIVTYSTPLPYIAIGLVALLCLSGIVFGRKDCFLWLALSFFATDVVLHLGLGFGISEVYIMAAHWIFVLPLMMAFVLRGGRLRRLWRVVVGLLSLAFFVWNGWLLTGYLLS